MQIHIQWYPGHMAKTKAQIKGALALVDLVLEVRDARIPNSSHNSDLGELVGGKAVITILAKADLAEKEVTGVWMDHLTKAGLNPVDLDLQRATGLSRLERTIGAVHNMNRARLAGRGRQDGVLRGLVMGIPNVGKSTLINRLAGRKIVKTGKKPGITRGKQWVKAGNHLQLLDMPGVLWPKFDDPMTGFWLAVTGAISDDVFDNVEVSAALATYIMGAKPGVMEKRYGIKTAPKEGSINDKQGLVPTPPGPNKGGLGILEAIAQRRGLLVAGGHVDYHRTAALFLREFRQGRLGPFTLEKPEIPA